MNIGIIDADLLDHGTRHPNLALMKISGYMKSKGYNVQLLSNYNNINDYSKVYLSKVFDFTKIPLNIKDYPNVIAGGSGLYWNDTSKYLPCDIEHYMPDYTLYDEYIKNEIKRGIKPSKFLDYKDKSIGFLTKGCVRKCSFCINENIDKVELHSPLSEFYDSSKKHIYLWDDNFLAYPGWSKLLDELQKTNKPFQFRQGLDIRLLTKEKADKLSKSKYKGDFIFAFDDINDKDIIKNKLSIWKKYCAKTTKLYVFCGFDRKAFYDNDFWKQDVEDTFERIEIIMEYGCLPYIMRHKNYENSPYRGIYINLARWCNQPSFYKKKSFREFCMANGDKSSTVKYMNEFEQQYPDIAEKYFDIKHEELNKFI